MGFQIAKYKTMLVRVLWRAARTLSAVFWFSIFCSSVFCPSAGAQPPTELLEQMTGKWEIDWDRTLKVLAGPEKTRLQKLRQLGVHILLEFDQQGRSNAVTSFAGKEQRKESTWQLMEKQNQVLVIATTEKPTERINTLFVSFLDKDLMRVASADKPAAERPGQGPPIVFKRIIEATTEVVEGEEKVDKDGSP